MQTVIEFVSTKVGLVLLVLGAMHFFNLFNFDRMRRKGLRPDTTLPQGVAAAGHITNLPPPLR